MFSIYSDVNDLLNHLEKIKLYFILPIILSFTASMLIRSMRQDFLLTRIDIKIPFKENILIYFAGLSMLLTPAAIGEMIKSHFLSRNHNKAISKTAPLVLVERFHDAMAMFSFLVIFVILANNTILTIPIIVIGIFFLSLIVILQKENLFQRIQKMTTKIKFLKMLEKSSFEFNNSLISLTRKKNIFYAWLISMAALIFDSIGIYLCFQAFGLDLNFLSTTIVGLSSYLFGGLSLIPAGIGVTEFSFVHLLSSYGLSLSVATALILFIRLTSDLYLTIVGIIATKFVLKKVH